MFRCFNICLCISDHRSQIKSNIYLHINGKNFKILHVKRLFIFSSLCRMILRYCFAQLRSTQVATIHCNAQTSPTNVLQKLQQTCMVISTNTGRVYRPKDCETLVLYLKDLNLPKPDKWGTCPLIAFFQQVILKLCANFYKKD